MYVSFFSRKKTKTKPHVHLIQIDVTCFSPDCSVVVKLYHLIIFRHFDIQGDSKKLCMEEEVDFSKNAKHNDLKVKQN